MMQEVEILKTIQELICSFFPKNSLHYRLLKWVFSAEENCVMIILLFCKWCACGLRFAGRERKGI